MDAALLALFIIFLAVAIWGELGENGTWRRVQRASERLDDEQQRRERHL